MTESERIVELEGISNFRDAGGYATREGQQVRSGRLFRSGHLAQATAADWEHIAALGIELVIDFRVDGDISSDGTTALPPGLVHVNLPIGDPAGASDIRDTMERGDLAEIERAFANGRAVEVMCRAASSLVRDRTEAFGNMLRHLAAPGVGPALIHCSAGKDRTGWGATLTLTALGVDRETVTREYLLSNRARRWFMPSEEAPPEWLRPLMEVREDYINAAFAAVDAHWGGFDGYLRDGLGFSEADLARLRENLLE